MPARHSSNAESFSRLMDTSVRLPGGFRIGLDGIIGLIPGVGDTATGLVSLWLLREAHREGLPKSALLRMGGNILIDTTLGSIPLVGDVFDFFWKSNMRNLRIIDKYREKMADAAAGTGQ
ncbi:MAG: DUF4112 domain-containing protein [Pseudohongiella sp.]|uniref:DUF4112 domain-containing protein n=1 Tax=Pseudohongiella sp. TaxID=1979412 RepID=UPI0034A03E73